MRSVRLKLDYIWQPKAKGRTYTYYRRAGQKIRIAGEPGSAEFLHDYQRIHATFEKPIHHSTAKPHSLKALIEDYKKTQKYLIKKPKTKKGYLLYLDVLETTYGHLPVATIPQPFVIALRDKYQDRPRTANFYVQVLSILMTRAKNLGWIKHNPAQGVELLETGEGHRPWGENEIALFRKRWPLGTLERTAFELALNTGQRVGDCATMERAHVNGGVIEVRQSKTSKKGKTRKKRMISGRVWIPISNDLRKALDAWDVRQQAWIDNRLNRKKPLPIHIDVKKMILTGEKGKAFGEGTFSHLINDACKEVKVQNAAGEEVPALVVGMANGGVTAHGLRFTAATRLRELGLSWDVIAAITGHDTAEIVEFYSERKRKSELAVATLNAATAVDAEQAATESVKPVLENCKTDETPV